MTIIRPCSEGAGYSGGTKLLKLKEIELLGFKSFADRTRLTCDGSTAAIVGPNGCGKSNLADAVSWVLGEQSARILRGERRGSGQRRRRIGKGYRNPRNRATRGATARV